MQVIDLEMSKLLSDAFFNPRTSRLFRTPGRMGLLDYATLPLGWERAGVGFAATRGGPSSGVRLDRQGCRLALLGLCTQRNIKEPSQRAIRPVRPDGNVRRVHPDTEAPASTGVLREFIHPGALSCPRSSRCLIRSNALVTLSQRVNSRRCSRSPGLRSSSKPPPNASLRFGWALAYDLIRNLWRIGCVVRCRSRKGNIVHVDQGS
jgi:hypothetical protein